MQRKIAFEIIYRTIYDNTFTNLLMRSLLQKLPNIQRAFVTNLVNGVLKNFDYLCYQHSDLYTKINKRNKVILSMALYERFFLDEKDYVVNNEYVSLGQNEFDRKFLNAILHKIDKLKECEDEYINHSLPNWLYSLLSKQYSENELNTILENYKRIPKVYYHINPKKFDHTLFDKFNLTRISDYLFEAKSNLINSEEFKNGMFYVQDINAAKLVEQFDFNENDTFLDACSAPGSKLFNALEYIKPSNAYANDISEKRVKLIKDKATLLGFDGVNYSSYDASNLSNYFSVKFDKILLDVPCSGLGVIGRRPDIKYHVTPNSLDELEVIQEKILNNVSSLLKSNGQLIYSTCTLNKKENEKQITKFLNNHSDFRLVRNETIINLYGDMFFYALLIKV